jgi:hypothetical protein
MTKLRWQSTKHFVRRRVDGGSRARLQEMMKSLSFASVTSNKWTQPAFRPARFADVQA